MPVATQVIPVVFTGSSVGPGGVRQGGTGLDTKTDSRSVMPGKFLQLENCVFTKPGVLGLRYGYDVTTLAIDGSAGNLTAASGLSVFNDELVLFGSNNVYSYAGASDKWMGRGRAASFIPSQQQVIRNGFTQANPDVAYIATSSTQGFYVYVWEDSRGGVRYSAQDAVTGAFYATDVLLHATATKPKVVTFGTDVAIFYASGANLFFRRIAASTPTVLSAQGNIITALVVGANHYDVMVVGSRLFILWNASDGAVTSLAYLDSATYALTARRTAMNAMANCLAMWTDSSQNIWCGGSNGTDVIVAVYSYATVSSLAGTSIETIGRIQRICGYVASGTSTGTVFYEQQDSGNIAQNALIRTNTMTLAGAIGSAADFRRSIGIASKCFAVGGDNYFCASFQTALQSTLYVINSSGDIVGRLNPNNSGGLRTVSTVSEVPTIATSKVAVAALNAGNLTVASGKLYAPLGVLRYVFDFASSARYQSAKLGNNLLFLGGLLQAYDGVSATEHGLLQFPEGTTAAATTAIILTKIQEGTGVLPEIWDVSPPSGANIAGGQYFTFSTVATNYYVWFTVDGAGADPAPAGTGIVVAINNYDSANTVGQAVRSAVNAVASANVTVTLATNPIRFTNTFNGNVTDMANPAAPNGVATGSIPIGTYQYRAVYERTDNPGQVHRSAPSPAVSITTAGTVAVTLAIPTLRLSNVISSGIKRAGARIAVYRTISNGGIFYRVTSLQLPLNDTTRDTVYVTDTITDAALIGNELLYTSGQVLDNIAPASASIIVTYRSRMFLAGFSDGNLLAYSKATFAGEAVAFSDALSMTLDPAGGNITALGVLDDKLVIFKRDRIYILSGDGPTNTGQSDDFGLPQQVASDVGCINPVSVVAATEGLFFMSSKGIYMLDRSLQVSYVGAAVEAYNAQTITGAALVPATNQIRFTTSGGVCLVFDYFVGQWSVFTNHPAVACTTWQSGFVYARSDGTVYRENRTKFADGDAFYRMFGETGEFQFAGQQGYQRCQRIGLLATYKGTHQLLVKMAVDGSPAFVQSFSFDAATIIGGSTFGSASPYGSESVYGGPFSSYQLKMQPGGGLQKSQMFRLSFETVPSGSPSEGIAISSLAFQIGVLPKMARVPATRRL